MVRQSFFRSLAKDHRRLSDIVMRMQIERSPGELDRLATEFRRVVRRHTEVEDKELYPTLLLAVDDWEDRRVLLGSHEDHRIITRLLDEMEAVPSDEERYLGKVHALDKLWNHHVEEEEEELYEMAQRYLGEKELIDLRRRIRTAEEAWDRGGS